jgi:hypothetical protein
MLIVRWILMLLLAAALVCGAMYVGTGQQRFKTLGIRIVKWTVFALLGFFGVLILERLAMMV